MRAPLNGIAHMQADQYHCLVFQRGKAVFYLLVKVGHFYPLHVQYDLLVNVFFISYLLRFSDRIDRMKNSYGSFFSQSKSRNDNLTRMKSVSCNQKSTAKMSQSVRNAFKLLHVGASSIFIYRSLQSLSSLLMFTPVLANLL